MKRLLPYLLGLSLLANALCVAVVWHRDRAGPAAQPLPPPAPRAAARPAFDAQTAAHLHDADLRTHAARLRDAGFPGDIVRAIIATQLSESNAARRRALLSNPDPINYWKQPRRDPANEKALRELRREETQLLREALGADAEPPDTYYNRETAGLAILPAAKADRLRQLMRERDDKRSDLSAANGYNSEDSAAVEREFRNAVRRELSPQEFFEFELRTSDRANRLREQLAGSEVTEEEFRAIYTLGTAHDEQFASVATSRDPALLEARAKSAELLAEQIRLRLGAERADEFERMSSYGYSRITEVVARLGLPRATAAQVSTVQEDFAKRRTDLIRANNTGTLERDAMITQLRGLQEEATAKITPLLGGQRGFDAYRKHAGAWIADLVPVR